MQHRTKQGDRRSTKKRSKQREAACAKRTRECKRNKAGKQQKRAADAAREHENCRWRAAQRAKRALRVAKRTKAKKRPSVAANPATASARHQNRKAQLAVEKRRRAKYRQG